jgi:hypothetical protein
MEEKEHKILQSAKSSSFTLLAPWQNDSYPWTPEDVDKLEFDDTKWHEVVGECRYFYRRDPFVSTVINKIVDLAINDLIIRQGTARENVPKVLTAIKGKILDFLRQAALEYLISGLILPEIEFEVVDREGLSELGIKRFRKLTLPTDMWVRDPTLIVIKDPMFGGKVSYFMKIPKELRHFIENEGVYEDQTEDKKLYREILKRYPEMVKAVRNKKTKVLLDNPLAIRRRYITGNPYPIPYLFSSIESLKHKRNLRRMDYSIAARVITAIMLVRMGNDEYPLTEDNEEQLEELRTEMLWREVSSSKEIERVFQLFGNHTLDISWVFPDVDALLDDTKYKNVNQDIAVGLGFPRILVTGETERSFASDPEIATISPMQTMERIRDSLSPIINRMVDVLSDMNDFGGTPEVMFKPINMMAVSSFVEGIKELYMSGNLSREEFSSIFGFDWYETVVKRANENAKMEELDVDEFAPVPHSNQPGEGGGNA